MRLLRVVMAGFVLAGAVMLAGPSAVAAGGGQPASTRPTCASLRPTRWAPATGSVDRRHRRGDLRVIGIQWKQQISDVVSYATFRTAINCVVKEFVLPHRRPGEPTLVVFNEDIGLMTLAIGSRGATVRSQATSPLRAPAGDSEPVSAAAALGELNAAYAPQVAAYQTKFGPIDPRRALFVAETDTFVRAFIETFSGLARRYGIYVVASNNMAPYRASTSAADISSFRDPSVHSGPAFVATSQDVTNSTFLWGPRNRHPKAPPGERNLLFRNEKVPLTSLESSLLDIAPGPSRGPAAIRNARGITIAGHHLGFATSLPAFTYGYPYGKRPRHFHPCQNLAVSYMSCMSKLGVNTVIQAEANPGEWAANGGNNFWQPLDWMSSSWRAVTDPTVKFQYAVNPMMVGNLLDLAFDGQSSIVARGHRGHRRFYVGDAHLASSDPRADRVYAGRKPQWLALAPWVIANASRSRLGAESAALAPGSGSAQENNYLETAVYADLLPIKARRH